MPLGKERIFSGLPDNRVAPDNPAARINHIQKRVAEYCLEEGITIILTDVIVDQHYQIPTSGVPAEGSEVTVTYRRPMLLRGLPILPTGTLQLTGRAVFRNLY